MRRFNVGRAVATVVAVAAAASTAMAYEEPEFDVVSTYDEFEIRRYAPYIVAETAVSGDFEDSGNQAFRILAGYIFGDNKSRTKMAMTIPVTRAESSEKMNMTVPVTRQLPDDTDGTTLYQFVMERKFTLETLPEPNDSRVSLRAIPARLVAARRYSGRINERNYRRNLDILRESLSNAGIRTVGEPQSAVYNGPFILPFLRRNEVLIDIDPASMPATDATAP